MIEDKSTTWGDYICGCFVDFKDERYDLTCDSCGKTITFESLKDPLDYAKTNWGSDEHTLEDICEECKNEQTRT